LIEVDTREKAETISQFKARGLEFKMSTMLTGDVICYNENDPDIRIVIERKRLDDLLSSYYSKRLDSQFSRLSDEKFAVLIITGNLEETLAKIPHGTISNIMEEIISLAVIRYNFRSIIWLMNDMQDVHYSGFVAMVKMCEKIVRDGLDEIPQKNVKLSKDLRVNSLMHFLGIDARSCKRLLDKHGDVLTVLTLPESELLKIKGVGPVKLKQLQFVLGTSVHEVSHTKEDEKCKKCENEYEILKTAAGNVNFCRVCFNGSI